MPYTVTELITNAWYLSGVVARNLETVSGDQISDGLNLLNDLLAIKTADKRLIPYYQLTSITLVAGQETYFIPNLVDVSSDTFNIGPVRYQMKRVARRDYWGSARVDNISSLPFSYNVERVKGGANISLYFLPQSNYPLTTMGKYALASVVLNQDLLLTLDRFYIVYLRYALAEYMCNEYNINFSPQNYQKLNEFEAKITDISPLDLTISKMSSMDAQGGFNWGDVNIGMGWRP